MKKEKHYGKMIIIISLLIIGVLSALIGIGNYQQQALLVKVGDRLTQQDYLGVKKLLENQSVFLRFSRLFFDEIKTKIILAEALFKKELGFTEESIVLLNKARKSKDPDVKRQAFVHLGDIFFKAGAYGKSERFYTGALTVKKPDDLALKRLEALKFYFGGGDKENEKTKKGRRRLREPSMLSDLYGNKKPQKNDEKSRR